MKLYVSSRTGKKHEMGGYRGWNLGTGQQKNKHRMNFPLLLQLSFADQTSCYVAGAYPSTRVFVVMDVFLYPDL